MFIEYFNIVLGTGTPTQDSVRELSLNPSEMEKRKPEILMEKINTIQEVILHKPVPNTQTDSSQSKL